MSEKSDSSDSQPHSTKDMLSWGAVLSRTAIEHIQIPPESLEQFRNNTDEPYMLIIFSPQKRSMKIEVFPVSSRNILKIQITLSSFSQEVFQAISKILLELHIDRIFTSGVCLREGKCLYEAYLEEDRLAVDRTTIINRFSEIDDNNIKEVILIPLD